MNNIENESGVDPAQPPIRLDHFLQMCGVLTGGQAKQLIQSGRVSLNGEIETRRKKKLVVGDLISVDGEEFEVSFEEEDEEGREDEGKEEEEIGKD